jgi:putative FmdB family regulatory protein
MPFYRYECRNCTERFRVLHQNGSSPQIRCPNCDGKEVDRLLPRIGVIYKGSKERERKPSRAKSEPTEAVSKAESPGED